MTLMRWNPIREFDDLFARGFLGESYNDWLPPVDVREYDDSYRVDVELPAMSPEDVSVTFKDGVLTVAGERKYERTRDSEKVHRTERRFGKFTRNFRLPEDADEDAIEASADRGVLSVTVGKREKAKPRAIEVKVH